MHTVIRGTRGLGLLLRMHADLLLVVCVILFSLLAGSWVAQTLWF